MESITKSEITWLKTPTLGINYPIFFSLNPQLELDIHTIHNQTTPIMMPKQLMTISTLSSISSTNFLNTETISSSLLDNLTQASTSLTWLSLLIWTINMVRDKKLTSKALSLVTESWLSVLFNLADMSSWLTEALLILKSSLSTKLHANMILTQLGADTLFLNLIKVQNNSILIVSKILCRCIWLLFLQWLFWSNWK